jgi:chemotaxis protein CheY-P-specific phosphatase CheC
MAFQLSREDLNLAAEKGERAAGEALSVLSKLDVQVSTQQQKLLEGEQATNAAGRIQEGEISAYTQAITGLKGTSVLTMSRPDALTLVDLFNSREKGTTVVMNELDRSTIKETLNILSNSYIVELAKMKDLSIMLSVPRMVTKSSIAEVMGGIGDVSTTVLFFETALEVKGADFKIELSFFFVTGSEE